MKRFFGLPFCLLWLWAAPQSLPERPKADEVRKRSLVNATDVSVPGTASQSASFQSRIWKMETEQNPSSPAAWMNRYLWTSRDKTLSVSEKQAALSQTLAGAEKFIANTAEYFLLRYLRSNKKDTASLDKALAMSSNKGLLLPYRVQQAVISQNVFDQRHFAKELALLEPLPADLKEYHHNVLMSADSNAVVYAQGLNDLVPLALMQQVHNVRRDIRLKYFDGTPVHEPNAYLCLSLGADVLKQYPNAAYTGLLVRPSGAATDELGHNIAKFDLRILQSDGAIPVNEAPPLYKNYLPSLLLLHRQLKKEGRTEAVKWEALIKRLGGRTGNAEAVQKQMRN